MPSKYRNVVLVSFHFSQGPARNLKQITNHVTKKTKPVKISHNWMVICYDHLWEIIIIVLMINHHILSRKITRKGIIQICTVGKAS